MVEPFQREPVEWSSSRGQRAADLSGPSGGPSQPASPGAAPGSPPPNPPRSGRRGRGEWGRGTRPGPAGGGGGWAVGGPFQREPVEWSPSRGRRAADLSGPSGGPSQPASARGRPVGPSRKPAGSGWRGRGGYRGAP